MEKLGYKSLLHNKTDFSQYKDLFVIPLNLAILLSTLYVVSEIDGFNALGMKVPALSAITLICCGIYLSVLKIVKTNFVREATSLFKIYKPVIFIPGVIICVMFVPVCYFMPEILKMSINTSELFSSMVMLVIIMPIVEGIVSW